MDDHISRQSAINALFELYEYQRDIDSTEAADLVRQGIYLAEKKIEKLPSAQPRWIPVTERLPDITEHYVSDPCIVYCSNGAYGFAELEENIFGQVGWNCERDDEYHEQLGEVVAWMPLPEPYKGEE